MPSRFGFNRTKPLIFLSSVIVCASCTPLQETSSNCRCSLSCDGAPDLKKHRSVIVYMTPPLQEDHDKIYNVSSLYDGGHCAVPGCFHMDTPYVLKMYPNNDDQVPELLVDKSNLKPVCASEDAADRKSQSGADKHTDKILILLAFCFLAHHLPP